MAISPRAIILRAAGTNCERETKLAFEKAEVEADIVHVSTLKHKKQLFHKYQIICLPGGFSYGDYISAGKVFALELENIFKEELQEFMHKGGLILGICNGFQILVKLGLLPFSDFQPRCSLILNDSGRFEDRWVWLKKERIDRHFWFRNLPEVFPLPVAHAEGKFYTEDNLLGKIEEENLVALRYVNEEGERRGYPFNPNGSLKNIAAVVNTEGNILGMMPHPERYIYAEHCPYEKEEKAQAWGLEVFKNIKSYFA